MYVCMYVCMYVYVSLFVFICTLNLFLLLAVNQLNIFDRVAVGDQLMLFRWPGNEEGCGEPMSAEDAVSGKECSLSMQP